jgi:hypothetical protein
MSNVFITGPSSGFGQVIPLEAGMRTALAVEAAMANAAPA